MISAVRRLQELGRRERVPLFLSVIDLQKAWDFVDRSLLWQVLARFATPRVVVIIRGRRRACVRSDSSVCSEEFDVKRLSPSQLFSSPPYSGSARTRTSTPTSFGFRNSSRYNGWPRYSNDMSVWGAVYRRCVHRTAVTAGAGTDYSDHNQYLRSVDYEPPQSRYHLPQQGRNTAGTPHIYLWARSWKVRSRQLRLTARWARAGWASTVISKRFSIEFKARTVKSEVVEAPLYGRAQCVQR